MADITSAHDLPASPWLAEHRATKARLRAEALAEIGRMPAVPELAAMIAVSVAALPLFALLHPAVPVHPQVWQVGLLLASVWGIAFAWQRRRYDRFHEVLRRRMIVQQIAEGAALAPRLLKRRDFSPAHPGRRPATGLRQTAG